MAIWHFFGMKSYFKTDVSTAARYGFGHVRFGLELQRLEIRTNITEWQRIDSVPFIGSLINSLTLALLGFFYNIIYIIDESGLSPNSDC